MPESQTIRYNEFLDRMGLAARQVGYMALQFYGKVQNIEKTLDREYVNDIQRATAQALCDVDLAAQEILLMALAEHYPFVAIDPEEDTPSVKKFARNKSPYTVIIDPIDGTLNYITQREQFAVIVGLLKDDRYVASLAYFPLKGELYRAVRDRGCTVTKDGKAREVRAGRTPNVILYESGASEAFLAALGEAGYDTLRGGCSTMDSTIAATRIGAASIFHRVPSVRRCIGALVSREAGGYLCDALGNPYDCTHPRDMDSLVIGRDRATVERLLPLVREEYERRQGRLAVGSRQ
jgi:fructose-1,6-bisphosphatase/inositol monophosphatase family enzyme